MFKKLKDKIAEEVKQSPLKSVQQLASAVVSPSSSSVFEPSSNDHFCIDDDDEDNQDTPKNSPAKAGGFTTVNLHGQTSSVASLDASFSHDTSTRSRKSSVSSVTSDASSFFPRYEPSSNSFHLQSDLESASEVEDSLNVQLDRVSKENLYEAYRKLRMRYNKYKGRFVDLAEHYRRLEKENTKCKNILLDTQDKALRRFSELREQCALEQEAKAHLEEALRSDLEEKDHLIRTLNTKIELLKKGDELEKPATQDKNLMDFSNPPSDDSKALEERVKNLELMLEESKASILEKNEIIGKHQNELASTKNLYSQKLSSLTKDLNDAKEQIEQLQSTVSSMKKREEESTLSLAENKLTVHKELEMRDEQLKRYKTSVEDLTKERDDLNSRVNQLQNELSALNGSNRVIDEEKTDLQVRIFLN
ncbi:golgin subfamily A member 4-like [Nilaparvata lugens]|uniref:golgin subfamily A member 4-like n=1 Tax=Nilaparvata lugens TaxID=108931 RepID=UPI00193E7AA2|nr:golgin subfamily A member 4-like [Nilaparvata lugens]